MKFRCEKVEQLTLTVENRPGILADLCAHLADHRINIRAITAVDSAESGNVRVVVDNPDLARQVLSDAGVACTSATCLALEMPNDPGGFAGIARSLSMAGINIDYMYASGLPDTVKALGIFGVSDLERALALEWGS